MTDRPIAAVIAGVGATVFVGAFSAAAVTRSDTTTPAAAAQRPAPATSQETPQLASLITSTLSPVVGLPALHLPKVQHHHHHHHAKHISAPAHVAAAPAPAPAPAPAVTHVAPAPTPVPTAVAPVVRRPVTPAPRQTTSKPSGGGYVGNSFDSKG